MAPNKRGAPPQVAKDDTAATSPAVATVPRAEPVDYASGGMITKEEVEARGKGTAEDSDTYSTRRLWSCEKRVFFTGLMFLTRLPCPGWCDHHPAYLMRSLQWFPFIGAVIGFWAATWLQAACVLWPPGVAAAVSTLATVWMTGCFHEDGLADTFDGFGGGWGKSQILRIMKDSRVGTYALVGMSLVLTIKLHCLATLVMNTTPAGAAAALIAAHAASRWSSLPLIYLLHYIQDEEDAKRGLYNWFAQSQRLLTPPRLILGTVTAVVVPWVTLGLTQALWIYATVVVVTLLAGYYANAVLGGVVGDYLGATIQIAELGCYMVLTGKWSGLEVMDEKVWKPLVTLAAVAAIPIIYCRRIIKTVDC